MLYNDAPIYTYRSINHFMDQLKSCNRCNETKLFNEFYKDTSKFDGLTPHCKGCQKKLSRKYYLENKAKIYEQQKVNRKKYRQENKHKILAYNKKYESKKRENSEQFRLTNKLRYVTYELFKIEKKSREILGVGYDEAYKQLLNTIPSGYTEQDWIEGRLEVDHKIPISWFDLTVESEYKQAGHISNLQLISKEENCKKSNRYGNLPNGEIILYEDWIKNRN